MASIKTFSVSHRGIHLKVRVLPKVTDVHREFTDGKRRRDGKIVHAFFQSASQKAKHIGTVVFPLNGNHIELVPHEVSHAVIHAHCGVLAHDDEATATAIGMLSAKIFRKLATLGVRL
jgi:hypothetical protein